MTKDEAFEKLVEQVDKVPAGKFQSEEQAFIIAAQALNYIMDKIDGSESKSTD